MQIALVVGNGFTLDLAASAGLTGLDLASPLSWEFSTPGQPDLPIMDALPRLAAAAATRRSVAPSETDFDILRALGGKGPESENSELEVEVRHFLVLAYRCLTGILAAAPLEAWHWYRWIKAYGHRFVTTVSFNYDCLLEEVLRTAGIAYNRQHRVASGVVRVFKPHGSADFDLEGLVRGTMRYPLRHFARMNNFPFRIIDKSAWNAAPSEALAVIPFEENPYANYQWVSPGYQIYRQLAGGLTHCVFAGLGYHHADRREIDHCLYSTGPHCKIIVANPDPPSDFIGAIERSGRECIVWGGRPENITAA